MRGQPWDKLWYKIVSIRLDPSRDQSYEFMTLQLPFLLDASSNKRIAFEIMALVEKNLLNSMRKQGRKPEKIEDLINDKPPKLDEKIKKKIDHSIFCMLFYRGKKPLKLS